MEKALVHARTVLERCDILGSYSEEPDRLTRRFASPPMQKVNQAVATWMRAAGMMVRQDPIGNLIGRYEADRPDAKTLLLGSHLDTVRDAGKYDGPLGVLVALACIELLHERNQRLPFAIEIFAFADEEGLRYHSAYLGSRAVTGTLDADLLGWTDAEGITMTEAIRAADGDPDRLEDARRKDDDVLGYCEVHIEQGPVLEALRLPVGVVSAITGHSRAILTFTGQAGHAGTVPMDLRHDALCAAAEFVLAVETFAKSQSGLVATVGQLTVQPGASNVIPGQVMLSLDVRHQENSVREQACRELKEQMQRIGAERQVITDWRMVQENSMVPCKPWLVQLFARAVEASGYSVHILPSGAGHDGVVMSTITDIAMLFVRCRDGISHNPAESVSIEDVAVAIRVMEIFLNSLAQAPEAA